MDEDRGCQDQQSDFGLKCFIRYVECLQNELDQLEVGDETNREAVVARKYFPLLYDDDFSRHNAVRSMPR